MKTLAYILAVAFIALLPSGATLKQILKDGHFAKLPGSAKKIEHEIVKEGNKKFGYLSFEAPAEDITKWIRDSKLIRTSTTELFEKNLMVEQTPKPSWYVISQDGTQIGSLYYAQRQVDNFLTNCSVDPGCTVIHLEYKIDR